MKKFIISCDFYNNTFKYFKSIKKLYFFSCKRHDCLQKNMKMRRFSLC